jgi:1-deoxy-D-xylulose-5-phosphate reductoisomerase
LTVTVLTANTNAELLIEQARLWKPSAVVIGDAARHRDVADALSDQQTTVLSGPGGLEEVVQRGDVDTVLAALVGFAGLRSTIGAIEAGKEIALANKETLVVAGELIMALARQHGVQIVPVDSEHSAIYQCLVGEKLESIHKVVITASGGPFRGRSKASLGAVTKAEALNHPKWSMGHKITIDSATLMNKGLEIIEARWLFDLELDQIEVAVHPQSIIHSLVYMVDGSVKAQLSTTDMRHAILYALAYPERLHSGVPGLDWLEHAELTFEAPDLEAFPCLSLARQALEAGGTAPCVLNASNEVAVRAFLQDEIGFLEIPEVIRETLSAIAVSTPGSLADYVRADESARAFSRHWIAARSRV